MSNPIVCEIGGLDYSQYLKGLDTAPAGPGVPAMATLHLTKEAGGLTILNKAIVKVWQTFDSAGNGVLARGRYFGGFVDVREEGNVGTTEIWQLPCVSFQVALHSVVRDANASAAFTVTAGTFAAQVLQIVTNLQKRGAASVELEIDAVTNVANLASGLPSWIAPPGKSLDFYLKEACRQAKIIDTALRPAYFIDTQRDFGALATFGGPALHVYDAALTPSPIYVFSDTPSGAEKSIYGELTRTLESQHMVQRKQAVYGDGFVATYTSIPSGATYRNPLINHGIGPTTDAGYWIVEAVDDTTSTTNAEAEAALALQVQPVEFPRERVVLPEVYDIVLPGEVVTVEHSLHIPTPTNYRVVEASFDFSDPTQVTQSLTLGTRRRELLDTQEEASGAQPREGDPVGPDAPGEPVEFSDIYDPHTETSTATFTFTASPSADTEDYEYIMETWGTEWGPFSTGGALNYTWAGEPGYGYATYVRGVDASGNRGPYSTVLLGTFSLPDVTREVLNPSFEEYSGATIYNWVKSESGGGTVTIVTGGVSGVNCLSCNATGVGASATAISEQFIEVQALRTFVFSVFAKATTAMSSALTFKVHWYTALRALVSTSTVHAAIAVGTGWPQDPYVGTAAAPATAAYCKIEVGDITGSSAAALLVDMVAMGTQVRTEDIAPGAVKDQIGVSLLDRARLAPGFRNLGYLTSNAFREADIVHDGTDYHVFNTHVFETENTAHRSASTLEGIVGATPTTAIAPVKYPTVVKEGAAWHLWGTITSPVGTVHYTATSPAGPYTYSDTVNIVLIDVSIRKHPTNGYWYGVGFEGYLDSPMQLVRATSPDGPWTDMGDVFADAGEPAWSTYSRPDPTLAFTGGRSYLLFGGFPSVSLPYKFGIVELDIDTGRVKGSAVVHYDERDAWQHVGLGDHTFLAVEGQPDRIFSFVNDGGVTADYAWGVMELPEYPPLKDGRRHDDVVRLDMSRGFDLAANLRPTTRSNTAWQSEGLEITVAGGGAYGFAAAANLTDFMMLVAFTPTAITGGADNVIGSVCVETSFVNPGRLQVHIDTTGKIAAKVQGADAVTTTLTSATTAVVGTRYDVVFRKQGGEVKLWINGVLADTDTHAASSVLTNLYVWSVGNETYTSFGTRYPYVGTIHAFNVVGSALPPSSTLYYPPAKIVSSRIADGAIGDAQIGTLKDPLNYQWDIETNPLKFYNAGSVDYKGALQYNSADDRLRLSGANVSATTNLHLQGNTSASNLYIGNVTTGSFGTGDGRIDDSGNYLVYDGTNWLRPVLPIVSKSAAYTLTADDYTVLVDASGAARTMTLPTAVGCAGRIYVIVKTDTTANKVTVDGNGSQTIDGSLNRKLYEQGDSITIQSDNANWKTIAQTGIPKTWSGNSVNFLGPEYPIPWTYRPPSFQPYLYTSSPVSIAHCLLETNRNLWGVRLAINTYVETTNDASNYWEVHLTMMVDGSTMKQVSTGVGPDDPDTWYEKTTVTDFTGDNPFIRAGITGLGIVAYATGTPGGLYPTLELLVRRVYT